MRKFHFLLSLILLITVLVACSLPGTTPFTPTEVAEPSVVIERPDPTDTSERLEIIETLSPSDIYTGQSFLPLILSEEGSFNFVPIPDPVDVQMGNAEHVPDDILLQVDFYFMGGGGAWFSECNAVIQDDDHPSEIIMNREPILVTDTNIIWCICNETIGDWEGKINIPNGETQALSWTETVNIYPNCKAMEFKFGPGSILGKYKATLTKNGESLTGEFTLVMPEEPTGGMWNNSAWFIGFEPYEQIRLLFFGQAHPGNGSSESYVYMGEKQIEADGNGAMQARIEKSLLENYNLIISAIGATGTSSDLWYTTWMMGVENLFPKSYSGNHFSRRYVYRECGEALPYRLTHGVSSKVIQDGVVLYEFPPSLEASLEDQIGSNIAVNTLVSVIGGPICDAYPYFEGIWSWKVQTPDGKVGFVIESDPYRYYLEPLPSDE